MKRCLCAMLCLIMLLAALPELKAQALTVTEVMQVYKCNEYVSLRQMPDKKSDRLKKVYLGELVTDCHDAGNGFIRCEWDGTYGYILAEYLKPRTDIPNPNDVLKNQMVYNCNEYVSLRKEPDSSSERLIKVPLGAIVTGCAYWPGNWIRCEYKGKTGFIMSKYLKTADYTVKVTPTPTVKPTVQPTATPKVDYPPLPYEMVVVNCNEWVSLRAKPTSNSQQLARVPLGSMVTNCSQANESYASVIYQGMQGYISLNYLAEYVAEPDEYQSAFSSLPEWPTYEQFSAVGTPIVEYSFGGYTVSARRSYAGEGEEMMIVCFDPSHKASWITGGAVDQVGQVDSTYAFVAGTADKPLIVQFVSGEGFTAYEIGPWSDVVWQLTDDKAKSVSGGLTTAVDADGTIYAIGFFNAAPICIAPDGTLKWAADNANPNIYWPYRIIPAETEITVLYDSVVNRSDMCYVVSFGLDGALRRVRLAQQSDFPDEEPSAQTQEEEVFE